jgi:hypothetical protein
VTIRGDPTLAAPQAALRPLIFVTNENIALSRYWRNLAVRGGLGRKPVGKVAMPPAERQRLYMQRLKDKAAANGKEPGLRQIVTDETRRMEAIGGAGFEYSRQGRTQTNGAACGEMDHGHGEPAGGKAQGRGSQALLRGQIAEFRH